MHQKGIPPVQNFFITLALAFQLAHCCRDQPEPSKVAELNGVKGRYSQIAIVVIDEGTIAQRKLFKALEFMKSDKPGL